MNQADEKILFDELIHTIQATHLINYFPAILAKKVFAGDLTPSQLCMEYVNKPPTSGYARLWENHRLDLAVEAIVCRQARLFPPEIVAKAKKRLEEYGYVPSETRLQSP